MYSVMKSNRQIYKDEKNKLLFNLEKLKQLIIHLINNVRYY